MQTLSFFAGKHTSRYTGTPRGRGDRYWHLSTGSQNQGIQQICKERGPQDHSSGVHARGHPFFFRLRNPHFTGDFSLCSAQKRSKHLIACTPPACTVLYLHREIKTMGVQSQAHPMDLHQAPCSLTSVPAGRGRVRAAPLCLLTRDPHPI